MKISLFFPSFRRYRHRLFRSAFLLAGIAFLLAMAGCKNGQPAERRLITVSIEPLRYITESIAGGQYEIATLTPEGVSPETYMPTPRQLAELSNSSAYLYLASLSFEQQNIGKITDACPHLCVENVSEGIAMKPHEHPGEACCEDGNDPHIWTSPDNMKIIAVNVHKVLCLLDPEHKEDYSGRLLTFVQRMDSLDSALHKQLDSLQHRTFLINHPSLVTWTPFNEEFWPDETQYPRFITDVYTLTKQLDPSRPINGVSGGIHIKTDIWTEHHYEQNPERLREIIYNDGKMFVRGPEVQARLRGNVGFNRPVLNDPYTFPTYQGDIPYILDEFGGIKCMEANPAKDGAWGYGDAAQTKEDFYKRLEGQVRVLIEMSDKVWGYCYTQLTDVEQEQNGIYYYDRGTKYDMERVKAIFQMALPEQK